MTPNNKDALSENPRIKYLSYLESLSEFQIDSINHEKKQSKEIDNNNMIASGGFVGTDDEFQVFGGMTEVIASPPAGFYNGMTIEESRSWVIAAQLANIWWVSADVRLTLTYAFNSWTIMFVSHRGSRLSGFTAGAIDWNETYGGGAPSGAGYAAYHEVNGSLIRLGMFYESVNAVKYFVLQ